MAKKNKNRIVRVGQRAFLESPYVRVKQALEDNRYKYRTLRGVAKSAGVPLEQVSLEIANHPDEFVVLARKNQAGERLYTTREHYKKKANFKEKFMGALINRVY